MTPYIGVMVAAVLISVAVMLVASKSIYGFVNQHPTVKMLALAFLLMIGLTLIAEGFDQKIPKGYIYFSIAFAVFVEALNLRIRSRAKPVQLHEGYREE
jgi:predicted tellurium resistance membrane protein TerC